MPKVSIIVPNYNHARFLSRRVESILRQNFQDFELILLDDCSTDDSPSILSWYATDPRVRVEVNEVNSGSSFKQWNKGVSLACGEYVWIAESDDYADPRFLEKLTMALNADPAATFAYCRSWRVSHDGKSSGFVDPWFVSESEPHRWTKNYCVDGHVECRREFLHWNIVPNASAVVFRKSAYQQVGGADETLRLCGDWKLWAAMALTGRVLYLAEPLNYFRFHDASVRKVANRTGVERAETLQVVWWILDQITQPDSRLDDPEVRRELAKCCMYLAFQSYPDFSDITHLALHRSSELGGADFTPPFSTWKGELLTKTFGWKTTRRAQVLCHRFFKSAWNAMSRG